MNKLKFLAVIALVACQSLSANVIQLFYPGSYQNAAKMHPKESSLVGGTFFPMVDMNMQGTILGTKGSEKFYRALGFPYMLVEQRFTDWLVVGLDISQPVLSYIFWPVNGFQGLFGTNVILNSYQVTPKASFKITNNLYLGASFNFLEVYRAELNYRVATGLTTSTFLQNTGTGQAYGGSVGLWYNWGNKTFIDFSYFSRLTTTIKGYSVSGAATNLNMHTNKLAALPDTLILNIAHVFNKTYSGGLFVACSLWSINKELDIYNTATGLNPFILVLDWKNTVNVNVYGRIQIVDKFAITGIVGYDQSPVDSFNNSVVLPLGHIWYGGAGAEYHFNDKAFFKISAGQGRQTSPKLRDPAVYVDAKNKALYTWVDLNWTIKF